LKRFCLAFVLLAGVVSFGFGQDVSVKASLDLNLTYSNQKNLGTRFRTYDELGHISTFALELLTDPGLRIYIAQKLERIPHDADDDPLDAYYVERPGIWRVGKQYYQFGSGSILRESVLAVRSNQIISAFDLPLDVTAIDGGTGHTNGVVIQLGRNIGASLAIGSHFAISGTSLDYVRHPEQAPGVGRGFDRVYGLNFKKTVERISYSMEYIGLRQGATALDRSDDLYDGSIHLQPDRFHSFELGITYDTLQEAIFYRVKATIDTPQRFAIVPMVRFRDGLFYDLSVALEFKL